MTNTVAVIALTAALSAFIGVAAGWYLRGVNAWCPSCGGVLACGGCGERPTWGWRGADRRAGALPVGNPPRRRGGAP